MGNAFPIWNGAPSLTEELAARFRSEAKAGGILDLLLENERPAARTLSNLGLFSFFSVAAIIVARKDRPWRMEEKVLKITVNLASVGEPALRASRTAVEIVFSCLPALDQADFNNLSQDGFFQLTFAPQEDNAEKRPIYRGWLLGKGFQELATGVRSSLEQAYIYCAALKMGSTKGTLEQVQRALAGNARRASRMNFPDLIEAVESQVGTTLQFRREMLSLNKTRNCLEHRAGIVSAEDCAPGETELKLDLPHLKTTVEAIEVKESFEARKGSKIEVSRATRTRTFSIGSKIAFSSEEFSEIAVALQFFIADLSEQLKGLSSSGSPSTRSLRIK